MSNPAEQRTILVAVCGGIAAYKTVEVVSRLRQAGHDVHVVMSKAACEFVTPLTFAAVSGQRVLTAAFPDAERMSGDDLYPHLYPSTRADVFILMPATADMIGRIAQGRGDDMVEMCALSLPTSCRRYFCPAMNMEMWRQPVVQDGVRQLEDWNWIRLGPATGALACGTEGPGRMVEPETVLQRVQAGLADAESLRGRHVLILSGPTREHLDPVRYLGNASSGRMGRALAEEAADRGATVTLVTGPVHDAHLPCRKGITIVRVVSAEDMLAAARAPFQSAAATVFAAAVADYRPAQTSPDKQGKPAGDFALSLTATPDVAATLSTEKRAGQITIGFALQTGDGLDAARAKLQRKNLDAIALNHPEAMDAEAGTYTWLVPGLPDAPWGQLDKPACARRILDFVAERCEAATVAPDQSIR